MNTSASEPITEQVSASAKLQTPSIKVTRPGDPLAYISASRLKSYLTCPLKFWLEKVAEISKPASISLHVDKAIYAALQYHNRSNWLGNGAALSEVQEAFLKAYRNPQELLKITKASEGTIRKYEAIGLKLLESYRLSGLHPPEVKPMGVGVNLIEMAPGVGIPLKGIVDLVLSGPRVIYYKTVAAKPVLETERWLHEIHLTMYAQLIRNATGDRIRSMELVFLVKTKKPQVISLELPAPTLMQRERLRHWIYAYVEGVTKKAYYPCPGNHCSGCQYSTECRRWPVLPTKK